MRKALAVLGVGVAVGLVPHAVAAKPPTADGKPCPRVSQLVTIKRGRSAVPYVERRYPGRWDVNYVGRGESTPHASAAARACGDAVVRKSVFVVLHPQGQTCSACNLGSFVVRYRSGRFRVWFFA